MNTIQPQVDSNFNYQFNKQFLERGLIGHHPTGMLKLQKSCLRGDRVKNRLDELGQTQSWLAERMALSDEAISKWIKGKSDPKLSNLARMAELLRCSIGYLVGDVEDDDSAEVLRIMQKYTLQARKSILLGVIAVSASIPDSELLNNKKQAS